MAPDEITTYALIDGIASTTAAFTITPSADLAITVQGEVAVISAELAEIDITKNSLTLEPLPAPEIEIFNEIQILELRLPVAAPAPIEQPANGRGLTWIQTASDTAMSANHGYICIASTLQRMTLPLDAVVGDIVALVGSGATLFRIEQLEGQWIRFNASATTLGLTGRVDSLSFGAGLELVCKGGGNWLVRSSNGHFEVA